ncbi:TetR/AcrR family transcriptional regulator [Ferruginibacter sp. HRS2-29]|uniref:TetR/AcrR family transcriptional regulator n=1 Tax=Ferruginibacter sp. HRS2-29 TaxID=2487334 RepID=UPI0020CF6C55|nr:TetR/AcrR family transcriptional regulator [Ferruginibacter sp. HRS2-29]MCP9752400.1 TetR/AcrR family transcriptional regulator [Ferruginibacter sp. HRS2-29]
MKFVPRSEETRQFIIEKTAAIFNKKGYAGTSMSDLTAATNLTKGSIYGNFENKESVALAVFDYNAKKKNKFEDEKLALAPTYKEKLMVYAHIFCQKDALELMEGGCPLLNTGIESDDTHEPLRKKVGEELSAWKKKIQAILSAGIKAKEFVPTVDMEKFALSVIALIEGGIFVARATKNKKNFEVILKTVEDMIENISLVKN